MNKLYFFMIAMSFALAANAQFSGDYDPANWTLTSVSPNSDASVDTTGAPNSITFNGNDSDAGECCDLFDEYSVTVAVTGFISFTYDFEHFDIEQFYYSINGVTTLVSISSAIGDINDISVTAGDVFGFRIFTEDDCCGRGIVTISNFAFNTTLGMDDQNSLSSNMGLYPTSSKGLFELTYTGNSKLKKLNVFNMEGKLIRALSLDNFDSSQTIDLTGVSNGLYLINIISDQATVTKKLLI